MSEVDEWGKDPAVRAMRKVFKAMEDAQGEFFGRMGIGNCDRRIRNWREKALVLFERIFSNTRRPGVLSNEKVVSEIYLYCLARIMRSEGINIPETSLPETMGIEEIIKEEL
jgi:hypothetical protein